MTRTHQQVSSHTIHVQQQDAESGVVDDALENKIALLGVPPPAPNTRLPGALAGSVPGSGGEAIEAALGDRVGQHTDRRCHLGPATKRLGKQ